MEGYEDQAQERVEGTVEGAASEYRNNLTEEDKSILDNCNLIYNGSRPRLEGTIETGEEVEVYADSRNVEFADQQAGRGETWRGTLGGRTLTSEEAKAIFDKYHRIGAYQNWTKLSEHAHDTGEGVVFKSIYNEKKKES